jgi:hypothetical protein
MIIIISRANAKNEEENIFFDKREKALNFTLKKFMSY